MVRKLIALVALLSGLAALGAPVAARAGEMSVGVTAAYEANAKCQIEQRKADAQRKRPSAQRAADRAPCPKPTTTVVFPPVMLGVDLALE